mmetsp:Transcript_15069/g.43546  ORF Transcript_15069/g.43546 Transcript_15069/m.43546 type:complete len:223 (+) Transcript_15069:1393-2061(+)
MSCSHDSFVAMPSSASLGSIRWFRSRQRSSATASGNTSSAPRLTKFSLMRSYCARTVADGTLRTSTSCQALFVPHSPRTKFLGAPGNGKIHNGLSLSNLSSCRNAAPAAEMWAAFMSTESPGFNLEPYCSNTVYAHTIMGVSEICSGVSSSKISFGTLMTSSSWQGTSVLAVPTGLSREYFVGFGRMITASSCFRSSTREPACSIRPTPVIPKQTPDFFSGA